MREFVNRHSSTLLHPWAGGLIAIPIVVGMVAIGHCKHDPSYAALAGATVAVLGVLTVGRPILRLGYDQWLNASRTIDGGSFKQTPEQQKAKQEENRDAQAIQLSGPLLIIFGTLLNGASGFLA